MCTFRDHHGSNRLVALYLSLPDAIAQAAVDKQRLNASPLFNVRRLTWVSLHFLIAVHRSQWCRKPGHSRMLRIWVRENTLMALLEQLVHAQFVRGPHRSQQHFSAELRAAKTRNAESSGKVPLVLGMWLTDRRPLRRRNKAVRVFQLALKDTTSVWDGTDVVEIEDITSFVVAQHGALEAQDEFALRVTRDSELTISGASLRDRLYPHQLPEDAATVAAADSVTTECDADSKEKEMTEEKPSKQKRHAALARTNAIHSVQRLESYYAQPLAAATGAGASAEREFNVATLNVLADAYVRPSALTYCPVDALHWDRRKHAVAEVVRKVDADVLCLQEADHFDEFHAVVLRDLGYSVRYVQRTGPSSPDGCAVAFKDALFEFVAHEDVLFNDLADRVAAASSASSSSAEAAYAERLRKHNVAVLVRLRHRSSGSLLVVASAHLYWNPSHPDIKLRQAHYLMQRLSEFAADLPTVLCGDFNVTPESPVYRLITGGKYVEQSRLAGLSASRLLVDSTLTKVCKMLRSVGVDAAFHSVTDGDWKELFARARREQRLIVTTSRKYTVRKECPPFVRLSSSQAGAAFVEAVRALGIQFDKSRFYSRCLVCNTPFVQLDPEQVEQAVVEAANVHAVPEEADRVYQCPECRSVYWWGVKSDKSLRQFERAFAEAHGDSGNDDAVVISQVFSGDATTTFAHTSPLRSAYDPEPVFTNLTGTFGGTLDYIFYSPQGLRRHALRPLPTAASIVEPFTALPCRAFPSDHLLLQSSFELRS
eukprot:TRINITY_DN66328_c10_g6_i1.p1 TRINITY_DN66328_c10_g6~~TRINITY_DN66328_c10_g6_i1.p1  ORF type:complete len:767 (+),score=333.22 TRINITY_DN66328_c10_g6_i1:1243-3543(+)